MPANSRWDLIQLLRGWNCYKPRERAFKQFKWPLPQCVNIAILNIVATGWHETGKVRNWHFFFAQCLFLLNILVTCYIGTTVSEEFAASVFGVFQEWTLHRTLTGLPWRQGQQVHSFCKYFEDGSSMLDRNVGCLCTKAHGVISQKTRISPLWEPQI